MTASFFSFAVLFAPAIFAQGSASSSESLAAAQSRLRYARDDLDAANAKLKSQEKRLKEVQDSAARAQKKLEEENAKVEQAKSDLATAKSRAEEAQKKHDDASVEIRRFYQERQGAPAPAKPQ
jgi:peptidoglycan hydrolase CwlO-like protein